MLKPFYSFYFHGVLPLPVPGRITISGWVSLVRVASSLESVAPTQTSASPADPMGLCTLAMTQHCMWAALGRGRCLQLRVSPGERFCSELFQATCVPAVGMSTQPWGNNPQHHFSTVIESLLSSGFSSWKVGGSMHGHLFSYILTQHYDLG